MAEAKATIPHFQVQTEVAMDAALALRAELKAAAGDADPVPSLNDLIVKASALALRDHPRANGSYRDGALRAARRVNVGIAVAADDALVVPTIFDADTQVARRRSRARRGGSPSACATANDHAARARRRARSPSRTSACSG